jgi:hypothetical protein
MGKKLIDFSVSPGLFPPFLGSSGEGETLTTFQVEESYTLKNKKKKSSSRFFFFFVRVSSEVHMSQQYTKRQGETPERNA